MIVHRVKLRTGAVGSTYTCTAGDYVNPFKPEFTIVIFIHYKPRLVVDEDNLMWFKKLKKIAMYW